MRKSNLHFPSVPPIQTVKGRVVFFASQKISTLEPLTVWIFAVAISPPKTGNRILQPCPRFRPLHSNGKTVCTSAAAVSRFCGGSAPAPPASPKEQDKGKCVTRGRGHLDFWHSPKTRMIRGFLLRSEPPFRGRVRIYITHPRKRLLTVHRRGVCPFFLPVPRRSGKVFVNNSKKHLTKRFMGRAKRHSAVYRPRV